MYECIRPRIRVPHPDVHRMDVADDVETINHDVDRHESLDVPNSAVAVLGTYTRGHHDGSWPPSPVFVKLAASLISW